MAALIVYTTKHRIVVPYQNYANALAAHQAFAIALEASRAEKLFTLDMQGVQYATFVKSEVVSLHCVNHDQPAWLREQKALELADNAKVQNIAQAMLQKSVALV